MLLARLVSKIFSFSDLQNGIGALYYVRCQEGKQATLNKGECNDEHDRHRHRPCPPHVF